MSARTIDNITGSCDNFVSFSQLLMRPWLWAQPMPCNFEMIYSHHQILNIQVSISSDNVARNAQNLTLLHFNFLATPLKCVCSVRDAQNRRF
jgi:hypothetical protein